MIFTQGAFLLPYTGVGSGFIRVRELDDKMEVLNDEKRKEVIVTFWRESNQENKLPGKIKDVVNFCTVPRTAQEIMERIGITTSPRIESDIFLLW